MIYILLTVLSFLVLFLVARLFLLKKELKRITSEMRDNENSRSLSVDSLDKDLSEMMVEVNKLYDSILNERMEGRDNNKSIRESISMISHDMRTPLTSVIGYLQVAERCAEPEEVNRNIEIALERARYLNYLVNDFFELSLIETGQVEIKKEKVNLCELVCEEILAESPEIDKKGLQPDFEQADENIYVSADKKKLVRVIQNLISNAVKYSGKKLVFEADASAADFVTLKIITDPGEPVDTEKIFDRFYQADPSRSRGGAGLGQYICKSFVEMMGGSIEAARDEENFTITLTLKPST